MAITMREVAAAAGVSIKTVSNVVNDYPFIKSATPGPCAADDRRARLSAKPLCPQPQPRPYRPHRARPPRAGCTVLRRDGSPRDRRRCGALVDRAHRADRRHAVTRADGTAGRPHAPRRRRGPQPAGARPGRALERGQRRSSCSASVSRGSSSITSPSTTSARRWRRCCTWWAMVGATSPPIGAQAEVSAQTAHQRLAGYRRGLELAGLPFRADLVSRRASGTATPARRRRASCSAWSSRPTPSSASTICLRWVRSGRCTRRGSTCRATSPSWGSTTSRTADSARRR